MKFSFEGESEGLGPFFQSFLDTNLNTNDRTEKLYQTIHRSNGWKNVRKNMKFYATNQNEQIYTELLKNR